MDWIIGGVGSGLIAGAAYWKQSLSGSGVWAAVAVGTILYVLGSPVWVVLMIGFFVTSSLLTKWKQYQKKEAESVYQKNGRRDAGQVLANGGLGALLCVAHAGWPEWTWLLGAYIGVMATVTADTWATEIGGLSRGLPRSIISWEIVPKGTSGGISVAGWTAAAVGAGFIGGLAQLSALWDETVNLPLQHLPFPVIWVILSSILAGWFGANVDSLLGAKGQAVYSCEVCGKEVEAVYHCGNAAKLLRGWRWLDNDGVNMISSAAGASLMVLITVLLGN